VAIQLQVNAKNEHEVNSSIMTEVYSNASDLQNQQEGKSIKGTVVDEAGAPIPGVTIIVKGTTVGTVTDMDGKFNLQNVPEDGILSVSFIGMQSVELAVAGQSTFTITLQSELQDIDEVVVIGYGVQKKSSLTGAVTQVKAEDMENRTINNPLQALAGKASGVQVSSSSAAPGSSPSITIRGINSNNGGSPLYVVDGRLADNISGIAPNDIESMEILKDAASAAIYGAQAGNGVILLTTKKGKKGTGTVSYDYQFTLQSIGKTPKMMYSEQYIDYFTAADKFSMDLVYKYWDFEQNTNWIEEVFDTSIMQRHSLNFQGGNEKGSCYLSGSMLDNDGMVIRDADTYKRYTGMINGSYNIKSWLEVASNNKIEYWKRRAVSEGNEYSSLIMSILQLDPMTPVTYTEANMTNDMAATLANYRATGVGELLNDGNGNYYSVSPYVTSENINSLIMRDKSYSESSGFNINGTGYLNLKPIKGLVVTSRFSYLLGVSESYGYDNDYWANSMSHQLFMNINGSNYNNTPIRWENFANYMHAFIRPA